jgi:hypothetical protein
VGDLAPAPSRSASPPQTKRGRPSSAPVDGGNIVEMTFDEEGNGIDETPVGNAADLPAAEGYEETTDEQ